MVVNCPHCAKQLKLNDKVRSSIEQLAPGKKIKVKCVHCAEAFTLDGSSIGAESFPPRSVSSNDEAKVRRGVVTPPAAPDIEWLRDGTFEDREVVEDIPRALVLFPDIPERDLFIRAASDFGYLVEQVNTPEEAIDKMRFVNYAAVFLHENYERGGLESGKFHQFMRRMEMGRRRYIFYVLIGKQFETLYDLQALTCSANCVVNDEDAEFISTVLRKTIPEYESLFGPVMEALRMAGK
jgi:hypothetical protein